MFGDIKKNFRLFSLQALVFAAFFAVCAPVHAQNPDAGDVKTGLIGHWKLDETTGAIATDSSPNGNNISLTGITFDAFSVEGKINNALNTNTGNPATILQVNNVGAYSGLTSFTVSFWVNPDGFVGISQFLDFEDVFEVSTGWNSNNVFLSAQAWDGVQGSWNAGTGALGLNVNQWNHVVITYSYNDPVGTRPVFYINGNMNASPGVASTPTGNYAVPPAAANLLSGRHDSSNAYVRGQLDDIRIYNRVLSADDAALLYRSYPGQVACDAAHEAVMWFNHDEKVMQYCNGTEWVNVGEEKSCGTTSCGGDPTKRVVFRYHTARGDFGGVAAADALCQNAANTAGLQGNYMAWISDSNPASAPASRFEQSSRPYVTPHGSIIANDWDTLTTNGTINNALIVQADGSTPAYSTTWSNVLPDGTQKGNTINDHCSDWTNGTNGGNAGDGFLTDGRWTDRDNRACNGGHGLYCFEQGPPATPTGCSSPTGKAGEMNYNLAEGVMQYCDGANWIAMGPRSAEAGSTSPGFNNTYQANAISFNTTDKTSLKGGGWSPTTTASTTFTGSFWIRNHAWPRGASGTIFDSNTDIKAYINASGTITLILRDNASTIGIGFTTPTSFDDTNWHHLMFSFDLSDTNKRHVFIDGVEASITYGNYANLPINFGVTNFTIGAHKNGGQDFSDVDFADFYFNFSEYINLSVEANQRKFIDSSGYPVDLGANGSNPTGSQPDIFLSGDTANWHTNKGTGGGFGVWGGGAAPLDDAATSPSPGALIAHWKLDETTGTTAVNSADPGTNDGTVNGTDFDTDSVAGVSGTAMNFDGGSQRIDISTTGQPYAFANRTATFAVWFRAEPVQLDTYPRFIDRFTFSGANIGYRFGFDEFGQNLRFIYGTGGGGDQLGLSSTSTYNDGEWHHAVVTMDGSEGRLYIDGILVDQDNYSGLVDQGVNSIHLGGETGGTGYNLTGNLDDVRLYNRALSATEVAELYATTGGGAAPITGCPNIGDVCDDGTINAGNTVGGPFYVAPTDEPGTYAWGGNGINLNGADSTVVPELLAGGRANADWLLASGAGDHDAAQACRDRGSDWYLPSQNELIQIRTNLVDGAPDINGDNYTDDFGFRLGLYWSSSENDASNARRLNMGGGSTNSNSGKTSTMQVRCIRTGSTVVGGRCSNPRGVAGEIVYNDDFNIMQYCNGSEWVALGDATGAATVETVTPPAVPCTTGPIGTRCTSDAAIYAGDTAGGARLYAAACDHGMSWNGTTCTGSQTLRQWKTTDSATAGTTDIADGIVNTDAMATDGIAQHPAAEACRNIGSAWYLPSTGELNILWENLVDQNGDDTPGGPLSSTFDFNTSGTLPAGTYWSSTGTTLDNTWGYDLTFNNGGLGFLAKSNSLAVRCVRR